MPEKIKARKDRVKLISTPDTLVFVTIQRIEADRESYREIVELSNKAWGQLGSVRNQRQMKSNLHYILKNLRQVSAQKRFISGATLLSSLNGGRGGIMQTVIGLLIYGTLRNGLDNIPQIDPMLKKVITGIVLLGALVVNLLFSGKAPRDRTG